MHLKAKHGINITTRNVKLSSNSSWSKYYIWLCCIIKKNICYYYTSVNLLLKKGTSYMIKCIEGQPGFWDNYEYHTDNWLIIFQFEHCPFSKKTFTFWDRPSENWTKKHFIIMAFRMITRNFGIKKRLRNPLFWNTWQEAFEQPALWSRN